ncbi:MAG TPA: hypothetical protein VF556_00370 [Pyrinomonadaceae bacterium]
MKQCPVCKTTYTDESLRFCLADGASLVPASNDQETVRISADRNPLRIDIQKDAIPANLQPVTSQNSARPKFIVPLIIIGLLGILFLGAVGVAAIIFLNPFGKTETAVVTENQKPSASPVSTADNQNNELREKLTNIEKQIQEQKNQKKNPGSNPFPSPSQKNSGTVTARVASTNDGFLSLRTEPSVKTGTQLVKIPSGATVTLENCEKNYMTVDGRRGRWCMVSYSGEIGWAFDAWLIY